MCFLDFRLLIHVTKADGLDSITTKKEKKTMLLPRLAVVSKRLLSQSSSSLRLASTLVVSEPLLEGGVVTPGTQSAVSAAQQLGGDNLSLLVVDAEAPTQIPEGVDRVFHVPIGDRLSETVASAIQAVCASETNQHVVAPATKFGSTVVPRAAALLQVSPVTDIIEIVASGKLDIHATYTHTHAHTCVSVCVHERKWCHLRSAMSCSLTPVLSLYVCLCFDRYICASHVCRQCLGQGQGS